MQSACAVTRKRLRLVGGGQPFAPVRVVRILISNDDGVYSPGLACLANVARSFGTIRVVAPDTERSSASHAITSTRPLSYRVTRLGDVEAYRVNGTPADSVALGTHLWEKVDVVLSGINVGFNLGHAIWHSGTLAAAKQAALLGLRGIALSAPASADPDFTPYEPWVRKVLEVLLPLDDLRLVSVNLPRDPRGMVWAHASIRQYDGHMVAASDPAGRPIYWFTVTPITDVEEGTDRWAIEQHWVSLTPLRLDPTDEGGLDRLRRAHPLDDAVARAVATPPSPQAAAEVHAEEAAALDRS
jgi:5'-nucleotidase